MMKAGNMNAANPTRAKAVRAIHNGLRELDVVMKEDSVESPQLDGIEFY
jgi:hypothetical protein